MFQSDRLDGSRQECKYITTVVNISHAKMCEQLRYEAIIATGVIDTCK